MTIKDRLFGSQTTEDDEPDYEVREKEEHFVLTAPFERVTMRFQFVRGGEEIITFDKAEEKIARKREIEGKKKTKRGNVRVEKFLQVVGGSPSRYENEGFLRLKMKPTGKEVTTSNVALREEIERKDMEARLDVFQPVKIREDTGEEIHRGWTRRAEDAKLEIVEVNNGK